MPAIMADSDDSESEDDVIGGVVSNAEVFDGNMDSLQQNSGDVFPSETERKKRAREEDAQEGDLQMTRENLVQPIRTTLMTCKPVEMLISSASFIVYSRNDLKTIAAQGECPLRDAFVLDPYFTGAVTPPASLSCEDARSNSLHQDLFGERRPIRKSVQLATHGLCRQGYQLVAICAAQTSPTQSNPAFILAHVGAEVLTLHLFVTDVKFEDLELDRVHNQEAKMTEMHMCDWDSMEALQSILTTSRLLDESITIEQRRYLNAQKDTNVHELESNMFLPWFRLRLAHMEEIHLLKTAAKTFYKFQRPSTDLLERHCYKSEADPSLSVQTNALSSIVSDAINSFLPIQFKTTLHSDSVLSHEPTSSAMDSFRMNVINSCILQSNRELDVTQFCSIAWAFLYHVPNPNPNARFHATRSSIRLALQSCEAPLMHFENETRKSTVMSVFTEEDLSTVSKLWKTATAQSMDSNELEMQTYSETIDKSLFVESTARTIHEAIALQYLEVMDVSQQNLTQRVVECLRNTNVHTLMREPTDNGYKYEWYDWASNQRATIDRNVFLCLIKHKNAIPIYAECIDENLTRVWLKKTLSNDIMSSLKTEFHLLPDI
jgi:hypothetical protein